MNQTTLAFKNHDLRMKVKELNADLTASLARCAELEAGAERTRWVAKTADTEKAERVRLQARTEQLTAALHEIAGYDKHTSHGKIGICPYGCDTPHIAQAALAASKSAPS